MEICQLLITKINLKNSYLKFHSNRAVVNELKLFSYFPFQALYCLSTISSSHWRRPKISFKSRRGQRVKTLFLFSLSGPVLSQHNFQFTLTTPSPMPAYLNVHFICETASRLLFLSMHWARAISAFHILRSVESHSKIDLQLGRLQNINYCLVT